MMSVHCSSCCILMLFCGQLSLAANHQESQQASRIRGLNFKGTARKSSRSKKEAPSSLMQASRRSAKAQAAVRRIENLVEYEDHGKAIGSTVSADDLASAVDGITGAGYKQTLQSFIQASGESRQLGREGNRKAAEYLRKSFEDAGFEVKEQKFNYDLPGHDIVPGRSGDMDPSVRNVGNIIGFKRGSDLANEAIVLGAHFDSVNWKDLKSDAPGVDDNGSGSALLLMTAQALKKSPTRRSVLLVGFNGEEEGLLGSKAFADKIHTDHKENYGDIKMAVVADEVAFPGRKQYQNNAIFETVGHSDGTKSLVDTFAHNARKDPLGPLDKFWVNWNGFGSDHIPLNSAGVPAMLLIERDDEWHADAFGHSSMDTFDNLARGQLSENQESVGGSSALSLDPSESTVLTKQDAQQLWPDYAARMTRLAVKSLLQLANPK